MTDHPVHARFDGPIVMIGFGSIGRGTLPLLERHIAHDQAKFTVIAPDDEDRGAPRRARHPLHRLAITRENYREFTPLLTAGASGASWSTSRSTPPRST